MAYDFAPQFTIIFKGLGIAQSDILIVTVENFSFTQWQMQIELSNSVAPLTYMKQ
jgi:hypothetical protein